jgi:hypothetical protein
MISDPARTRAKGRKAIMALWAPLETQSFPYLHELAPVDQDCFVLIDAYLCGCLEEWVASGGQLSAGSTRLLDDCARNISRRF